MFCGRFSAPTRLQLTNRKGNSADLPLSIAREIKNQIGKLLDPHNSCRRHVTYLPVRRAPMRTHFSIISTTNSTMRSRAYVPETKAARDTAEMAIYRDGSSSCEPQNCWDSGPDQHLDAA